MKVFLIVTGIVFGSIFLFAKPGDKILDTHLGSGSSRIAAHEMGYDFTGCEKDGGQPALF